MPHYSLPMSSNKKGLIVFATVLLTILLWAPISGQGAPREGGGTISHIYFGLFRYMTIRTEIKDPKYELTRSVNPARLGTTSLATVAVWAGVISLIRSRQRRG